MCIMPRLYNQDVAGVVRLENSLTLSGASCLVPCTTATHRNRRPHACQVNVGIGKQQQQQRHRYPLSRIPYRATINTMTTYDDDEGGCGLPIAVYVRCCCYMYQVFPAFPVTRHTYLRLWRFLILYSPSDSVHVTRRPTTDRGITRYSARMCGGEGGGWSVFQIRKKLFPGKRITRRR